MEATFAIVTFKYLLAVQNLFSNFMVAFTKN